MGLVNRSGKTGKRRSQANLGGSRLSKTRRSDLLAKLPSKLRLAVTALVLVLGFGFAAFGGLLVYYTVAIPNPLAAQAEDKGPVVRILAEDKSLLAVRGSPQGYVPLDAMPPHLINAVLATEDRRFFEHYGIDPNGLLRAFFANMRAGRFAQGGSTLTQQLAKNLFLSPERTLTRKLEEVALALWLEIRLSKRDILELYLNRVYFGGGAYGVEAASLRYFDKPARKLTLAEAAVIAGLLKAPSRFSPLSNPDSARSRGRVVLSKMEDAGFITREEELKAAAEPMHFAAVRSGPALTFADYAADHVMEALSDLVPLGREELVVETTVDPVLQRKSGEIVARHINREGAKMSAGQAAAAVLGHDGAIRAMIGGKSYQESQFNRAVKAKRQPGSVFKLFVYLAALEDGATPWTIVPDAPINVAGWTPGNENGQYAGPITLRQAMAQSVNTIAVRLYLDSGAGRVSSVAKRLGIKSDLRDDASLALGTSEVSLLEIAGAYAVLGNDGLSVEPYIIERVTTRLGKTLYERQHSEPKRLIGLRQVNAVNDMLEHVITSGTGKRAYLGERPAAGKTGTTQEFRDAWFAGYTADLTAAVWVGNDNGKSMNHVTGGSIPAEIWRDIMAVAHRGVPPRPLPGTSADGFEYAEEVERDRDGDGIFAPMTTVVEMLPWLRKTTEPHWWSGEDKQIQRRRAPVAQDRYGEEFAIERHRDGAQHESGLDEYRYTWPGRQSGLSGERRQSAPWN